MKFQLVGAYLPSLDPDRLARYVADDELNFVTVAIPSLRAQGFLKDQSDQEIRARAKEIAEEKLSTLQCAALYEVAVTEGSGRFDPAEIEPAAWEPAYLTPDGQALLEDLGLSVAVAQEFRVAFYVHDHSPAGGPSLLDGALTASKFTPVPERLWRLAPYALVD